MDFDGLTDLTNELDLEFLYCGFALLTTSLDATTG